MQYWPLPPQVMPARLGDATDAVTVRHLPTLKSVEVALGASRYSPAESCQTSRPARQSAWNVSYHAVRSAVVVARLPDTPGRPRTS